jgi:hypothetical protein
MEWLTDTAVCCLTDFIFKSIIWLLNGHATMIPLLPLQIDPDGIPVFRMSLNDVPNLPGVKIAHLFPNPEIFNIHSVMYFHLASSPFCIVKAFLHDVQHAMIDLVKSQIFMVLQFLIGRISIQYHHCECPLAIAP